MLRPRNGEGRKAPLSGETMPAERVKFAKPTDKAQFGKPPELGYDIANYDLPVVDVQTQRRNFPGYTESQYYTSEEIWAGDTSGTTETDSATAEKSGGYTRINTKSGPKGRPTRRS